MLTRTGPRWRPGLLLQCCPTTTQCTCTHTHTYTHNACPYIMVHPLPPPPAYTCLQRQSGNVHAPAHTPATRQQSITQVRLQANAP